MAICNVKSQFFSVSQRIDMLAIANENWLWKNGRMDGQYYGEGVIYYHKHFQDDWVVSN